MNPGRSHNSRRWQEARFGSFTTKRAGHPHKHRDLWRNDFCHPSEPNTCFSTTSKQVFTVKNPIRYSTLHWKVSSELVLMIVFIILLARMKILGKHSHFLSSKNRTLSPVLTLHMSILLNTFEYIILQRKVNNFMQKGRQRSNRFQVTILNQRVFRQLIFCTNNSSLSQTSKSTLIGEFIFQWPPPFYPIEKPSLFCQVCTWSPPDIWILTWCIRG